jgi:alcohol dehydrogenase class IV
MPVTDPGVAALGHPERIAGLIGDEGREVVVYERSRVEPTLGGGSAIDTAKVADSAGPTAPCPSATTGSELVAGALKQQRCW